jgi:serine/threonine-protein kinase
MRRGSRGRRQIAAGCITAAALAAGDAGAQSAQDAAAAEVLFEQAKSLMRERKYAEACAKLSESNRLDAGIGTMLWLADCYEKNGQSASAWAEFVEAADAAGKRHDDRQKVARERAAALEPTLSRLTVDVPRASDLSELEVTRDGAIVGRAVWGTPVPVDPGPHALAASAPGRKAWQATVTVEPGGRSGVVTVPPLEPEPVPGAGAAAPPVATPPPDRSPTGARADAIERRSPAAAPSQPPGVSEPPRTLGLVAAGIGVVGIAVGSVLGIDAKLHLDDSNADGHCDRDNHCDPVGTAERHQALDAATASTIAFAAGGVLVAAGLGLYFTSPRSGSAPATRKRGAAGTWFGLELAPVLGVHERGLALHARF